MSILIKNGSKQLSIADANPLRFVEIKTTDIRYKTKGFDEDFSSCYKQPFINADQTSVQILSDWAFTFKVYDSENKLYQTYTPTDKGAYLVGFTMHVYDVPIDFQDYPYGIYYAVVVFNDGSVNHTLQSEPWLIDDWQETILFEYTNSSNDFGIIFSSDTYQPTLRVEGYLTSFVPGFVDNNFIDQEQDVTLLESDPFRKFTLNISMVTDWVADKINRILSCDIWSIDGDYYQKDESAQWNITRGDPSKTTLKNVVNADIAIRPVDNEDNIAYNVDEILLDPKDEIYQIEMVEKFDNNGIDLVIPNIFRDKILLEGISIQQNGSPVTIDLKVGTSLGGSDIYEQTFNAASRYTEIQHLFDSIQTLYISGLNGLNTDVRVLYKDLDAKPLNPFTFTTLGVPVGAVLEYKYIDDVTFNRDFNIATGYGNADTEFVDYKINMDGAGKFKLMYDGLTYLAGATGGNNQLTILKANLPSVGLGMFANYVNTAAGDVAGVGDYAARGRANSNSPLDYEISKAPASSPTNGFTGLTAPLGNGTPINNLPAYKVVIPIERYQRTTN